VDRHREKASIPALRTIGDRDARLRDPAAPPGCAIGCATRQRDPAAARSAASGASSTGAGAAIGFGRPRVPGRGTPSPRNDTCHRRRLTAEYFMDIY